MHRIRLLGPWEVQGPEDAGPRTAVMPQAWRTLFGEAAGTARFGRWFHAPTNLDADERVSVRFDGIGGTGSVRLNDVDLQAVTAENGTLEIDVTPHLKPRNQLEVELRFDPMMNAEPGGLYGEIALVIEAA